MQFQIYLSVGSGLTLHLYKRKVTHSLWPFGEEDDCSYLQFNQAQMFYLCRSQVKRCSSIIVAHIHVMTKKLKVGNGNQTGKSDPTLCLARSERSPAAAAQQNNNNMNSWKNLVVDEFLEEFGCG